MEIACFIETTESLCLVSSVGAGSSLCSWKLQVSIEAHDRRRQLQRTFDGPNPNRADSLEYMHSSSSQAYNLSTGLDDRNAFFTYDFLSLHQFRISTRVIPAVNRQWNKPRFLCSLERMRTMYPSITTDKNRHAIIE